jgi:hypothetical protein
MIAPLSGDRKFLADVALVCLGAIDSPDPVSVDAAMATLGNMPELIAEHKKAEVIQ